MMQGQNAVTPSGVKRSETKSRDPVGLLSRVDSQKTIGIPRLRCAPLGITTVTSFLSLLELFLSQLEQAQPQLRPLPFSR